MSGTFIPGLISFSTAVSDTAVQGSKDWEVYLCVDGKMPTSQG